MIHFIYCFFFFCSQGSERRYFPTRGKSTKKSGRV
nr:MAG TPA: hypothetical protein [Caudoviricetes sp.]